MPIFDADSSECAWRRERHAVARSLIRAGRSHPVTVDGQPTAGTRVLWTGPRFFTTMQIPIVRGREIADTDRQGTLPVAVVSELFARTNFGEGIR